MQRRLDARESKRSYLEGEEEFEDVGVPLCLREHLQDPSLANGVLELLVLDKELLLHNLHGHNESGVPVANFEYPAK